MKKLKNANTDRFERLTQFCIFNQFSFISEPIVANLK